MFESRYPLQTGKVAEWSIATVLKTVVARVTEGSNPSLSAIIGKVRGFLFAGLALLVELVDTLVLGTSAFSVRVRVPRRA